MAKEHSHSPETDLDKTDELPILKDIVFDLDVEEEAAPLDRTAVLQGPPLRGPRRRGRICPAPRRGSAFAGGDRALGGGALLPSVCGTRGAESRL